MKKLAVVSDLHAGHQTALLPPNFITYEGVPKLQNVGQEFLWRCWLDFCKRTEAFNPDIVIVNGDCVEGMQRKDDGFGLSLQDWKDQRGAAIAALKVLRSVTRKAKWFHTQGTPYHTGSYGNAEEDIAEAMGALPYNGIGTGKLCKEVLTIQVDGGVIVEAAHHVSFSSVYRATPLEKEAQATWQDVVNNEVPLPDIQVRSHVHNYTCLEQAKQILVTTPCWKLQDRYARKASVHRIKPHLGGIFITADYQAKKRGDPACKVLRETYKLPPVPITIV